MNSWPTALFTLLTLLFVAQHSARAEEISRGWLIYSNPSVDPYYGPLQGQARRIDEVRLSNSPHLPVVHVRDLGHYEVTVFLKTREEARELVSTLNLGKSLDISACRKSDRAFGTTDVASAPDHCTDKTYRASFTCEVGEPRTLFGSWKPESETYEEANPRELRLYVTERECTGSR